MTIYSVFDAPADAGKATDRAVVADRFSWLAALLPPVYAVIHGLWLALVWIVAFVIVLAVIGRLTDGDATFWLYVLGAVFFGFEAPALRRAKLRGRGWRHRGDVIASAPDLAELAALNVKVT